MWRREVWTRSVVSSYEGPFTTLGDVLEDTSEVPESFFIPDSQRETWEYLKGPKREERTSATGHTYFYTEGGIAFPEPLDKRSRTILTGEGGTTPSRFKHVVRDRGRAGSAGSPRSSSSGLNGFPDHWTATGMPDGRRAFMMGNALVVGLIERVGRALAETKPVAEKPDLHVVPVSGI